MFHAYNGKWKKEIAEEIELQNQGKIKTLEEMEI